MTVRELGRGWMLQTWEDHAAMPRLACSRNGAVLALDADDDLVIEVEPQGVSAANWGVVVPLNVLYDLMAEVAVYRSATGGHPLVRP